MNASFDTLISFLPSIIENKLVLFILILIFIGGGFYYIWNKAKSGFSISNRIWAFWLNYKKSNKGDLINDILEIEKFNFHYNTNAVSKRQTKNFESWIKKYELDFKIISKLKNNLNIDTLKINKINKHRMIFIFSSIIIPLSIAFLSLVVAVKPAGLISINDSGWFWFNKNEATEYNIFPKNTWVITPEACKSIDKISVNLSTETISEICNAFNNEKSLKYIDRLIKEQRYFFGLITLISMVIMLLIFKKFISLSTTHDARIMILSKINRYRKRRNMH